MNSDLPVAAPVSELSHKTVIIYLCVFLLIVGGIGAALYFLVFKKKSCKTDSDCKTGEICNDEKCYKIDPSTKCKSDGDCGNNQVCDSGKCVTKPSQTQCTKDGDCGNGMICDNGKCVTKPSQKQCTKDGDCGNGMICDIKSGKCVTKPSQKQCQQDEDCGNAQCIYNKCVFANFIVAFDTADLPDGWVECDGNNGTPDIQGKFIKGCDNTGSDLGSIDPGESSHLLKPEEAYHEHTIPAQELSALVYGDNEDVSCFCNYLDIDPPNNFYTPQFTTTMDNQTNQQTPIDLTPACISVIFATPLNNSTNIFPIGTIIWLYNLGTGTPSLSGSDWEYYDYGTSDNFFIGRDTNHTLGKTFGNNKITLKQSDIPDHTHSFKYPLRPNEKNLCALESDISCPDGNIFREDIKKDTKSVPHTTKTDLPSAASFDILPPYQPLFCIKKKRSNLNDIPIGSICAWNIKNIPKGWSICDGTNSTPDLRSKFILNKDSNDPLGGQGGSDYVTLVSDNIAPTHTHTYYFQQYVCGHNLCSSNGTTPVSDCSSGIDNVILFHNISMCDTNSSNCTTDDNKANKRINLNPPHIKLIYIMKTN